jgi:hypothetical protein
MRMTKDMLTEIHAGKMHFKPESDSIEALKEFQAVAKRLEAATERNYIKDVKVERSRQRDTYNYALQAIAIGPLTLEGEKFLLGPSNEDDLNF